MAADEDYVVGGEGEVVLNGTTWCAENISISEGETSVPVNNVCDYDDTDKVTWERDKTTMRRITGSFTLSLDRETVPVGTGTGQLETGKTYTGTITIFTGFTYTGSWKIGELQLENNGVGGVWGVTIPFRSQGKITRTAPAITVPEP